jgi:hypothetical protein
MKRSIIVFILFFITIFAYSESETNIQTTIKKFNSHVIEKMNSGNYIILDSKKVISTDNRINKDELSIIKEPKESSNLTTNIIWQYREVVFNCPKTVYVGDTFMVEVTFPRVYDKPNSNNNIILVKEGDKINVDLFVMDKQKVTCELVSKNPDIEIDERLMIKLIYSVKFSEKSKEPLIVIAYRNSKELVYIEQPIISKLKFSTWFSQVWGGILAALTGLSGALVIFINFLNNAKRVKEVLEQEHKENEEHKKEESPEEQTDNK